MKHLVLLIVSYIFTGVSYTQYVGIGTNTPSSGLEIKGTGIGAQQRITDPASGNSLVLQSGTGVSMKVSGYNYGTGTAQPLYLSVDGANTYLNVNGGNVGIGTSSPTNTLDVNGFFRAKHIAGGNVVSETDGGVNAWAKFWARTPAQTWSIGTSHNFNGNQLYFSNENGGGGIRMAIMPNGNVGIGTTGPLCGLEVAGTGVGAQQRITDKTSGNSLVLQSGGGGNMKVTGYNYGSSSPVPLYLSTDGANTVLNNGGGNVLQPGSGYGIPKAMVYLNGDGTISRCYNGVSGVTTGGCGITAERVSGSGFYSVNFPFSISSRFISLSVINDQGIPVVGNYYVSSGILFITTRLTDDVGTRTDRPLTIIVY